MMDDEEVRAPTLTSSTGVELEIDSTSVGNKNVSSDENYSLSVVTSRLEQEEIEYLRMENALLKKKIKKFERARLLGHIAPSSSLSSVCSVSSSCSLATEENELEKVNALLEKAKEAKQEALTYVQNTSREKLGKEVQVLSSILQKAKMERHLFKTKIKESEKKFKDEKKKKEKEEIRLQVDREIFTKIIKVKSKQDYHVVFFFFFL
jgi:hypothetical protein